MSKRPPNELESRLHKAILSTPLKEMTAKETESIIPDPVARQSALNFLLGVGLIKTLVDASRKVSFRAVTKGELVVTKDLSGEENLVLNHIKAAGNEGIWTKHLKTKTNLHQTIIDRCLKTLTQKRLVKRVPSVQHPTRKIYMLEGLEPSIALTGGPWYTDNELDTEFIQHLTEACYKFICDLTLPKRKDGGENAIYAPSNPPKYPTAQHIRNSLKKARLTETELSVEHVEMLLNVLVLDGKIERLPAIGTSLWTSYIINEDEESGTENVKKKTKHKHNRDGSDVEPRGKKRRKQRDSDTLSESGSESCSSEDESPKRKPKKKKRQPKRKSHDDDSDAESERTAKKKKRKKKNKGVSSSSSSESSDGEPRRKKRKKAAQHSRSSSDSSSDSSLSEDESDDHRHHSSSVRAFKRSPSPLRSDLYGDLDGGSGSVYRAIKEEDVPFGWSEAPCALCPSFDFCKDGGPVNPRECVYYGDWLAANALTAF